VKCSFAKMPEMASNKARIYIAIRAGGVAPHFLDAPPVPTPRSLPALAVAAIPLVLTEHGMVGTCYRC
jgi:hypothetical protein